MHQALVYTGSPPRCTSTHTHVLFHFLLHQQFYGNLSKSRCAALKQSIDTTLLLHIVFESIKSVQLSLSIYLWMYITRWNHNIGQYNKWYSETVQTFLMFRYSFSVLLGLLSIGLTAHENTVRFDGNSPINPKAKHIECTYVSLCNDSQLQCCIVAGTFTHTSCSIGRQLRECTRQATIRYFMHFIKFQFTGCDK